MDFPPSIPWLAAAIQTSSCKVLEIDPDGGENLAASDDYVRQALIEQARTRLLRSLSSWGTPSPEPSQEKFMIAYQFFRDLAREDCVQQLGSAVRLVFQITLIPKGERSQQFANWQAQLSAILLSAHAGSNGAKSRCTYTLKKREPEDLADEEGFKDLAGLSFALLEELQRAASNRLPQRIDASARPILQKISVLVGSYSGEEICATMLENLGGCGKSQLEFKSTPFVGEETFNQDDLLKKLDASVRPILEKISERIDGYSDEDVRAIVLNNLNECRKRTLELKGEGLTNEGALDRVAKELACKEVIEPSNQEVMRIFQFLSSQDLQSRAFLERYRCIPNQSNGLLLKGEFMRDYRYGPLKKKMKERLKPFLRNELAPPINHDGFLRKLDASVAPVLQKISDRIENYREEEIRVIVLDNLKRCKENALELKKDGFTDEEIVSSVAKALAYRVAIKPEKRKVADVFRSLCEKDLQAKAFLKRDPFAVDYCDGLMRGEFMEKYRYGPLQKRMKERLKPFLEEKLFSPINHDGFLRKLDASIVPVLQKISDRIERYGEEEIRLIVRNNLDRCRENALELKKNGFTDEEIVSSVAKALAYRLVIKPEKRKIADVFRSLCEKDLQAKAFLKRDPFAADYCDGLMRGEFMEKYRYGPLQKRMKERLKPFLKDELAPFLCAPASFKFAGLLSRLWPF